MTVKEARTKLMQHRDKSVRNITEERKDCKRMWEAWGLTYRNEGTGKVCFKISVRNVIE